MLLDEFFPDVYLKRQKKQVCDV
uniref:Uncharacterized protein n=1 Tax=Anguilla anguilla TaxID=7936 RepID=A0A0E9U879_ANGAN